MLTLPIQKKWYDMILTHEKLEEYRGLTPYYEARFKNLFNMYPHSIIPTGYDTKEIRLRNGYSIKSPSIIIRCKLDIGTGKPEWGAIIGKEYYILKIENVREDNR